MAGSAVAVPSASFLGRPARPVARRCASARLRLLVAGLVAVLLGLVALAPQASAQGTVRATYGDWQQRCETPPGAQAEQCAIVQNVAAEDRPNVTLLVIVLSTADTDQKLLRVVAPLGVLLPAGLGLRVDDVDVGSAGFVRCLPTGCVAEVIMDEALVELLSGGTQATFIIFQTPEEGIGIPVSLDGFGEGFATLPGGGAWTVPQ
ncbi:invasion associated locus B family protein [Salinarimonas chemoclinalis]|uniref:invasion associated locus B family protein n=1 Tax=Salinarimonas chemoclinalis TaxID=3241599 RepID=UPI003558C370